MPERVFNFSAGPATLPLSVLQEAQANLLCLPGVGASILEISHRSPAFDQILEEVEQNLRQLLGIPENYRVLFLQGGASLQFSMIPMNFLQKGKPAAFVNTGSWAKKAVSEAKKEGETTTIWDGKPDYNRVPQPSELSVDPDAVSYVHFTSNETIQGIQFSQEPEVGNAALVCDASSDFLSRPIDVGRYAVIYAGAQKNAGPAGVTIAIVRDDLLERVPADLPTMLDYRAMAEGKSVYNTPPVFSIYIVMLVTRWLKNAMGGLEGVAEKNAKKAELLYEAIDHSDGFYRGHAQPDSRSKMNITWRLPDENLEQLFIKEAKARGLHELKGHRSVGGIRASIYNAMSVEGVQALRDFMLEFKASHQKG